MTRSSTISRAAACAALGVLMIAAVFIGFLEVSSAGQYTMWSREGWKYPASSLPIKSFRHDQAVPVGLGSVAEGGSDLDVRVALEDFTEPVDVYWGFVTSADPSCAYNLTSNGEVQRVSATDMHEAFLFGKTRGIESWLTGVEGGLDRHLATLPLSSVPPGEYTVYLIVTPQGDPSRYVLWATGFTVCADQRGGRSLTVAWDPPTTNADGTPLTDLAGFKVHYGMSPVTYRNTVDVGAVTTYTITGICPGTYHFAVTAYDSSGNESDLSAEMVGAVGY